MPRPHRPRGGHADTGVRARTSAQLAGLVMLRYVLAVEPLATLDFEELMEWLVPAVEVHVDQLPQE
ncbi:hypothetical protein OG828_02615 [Streptomyces sp. NBC_00457]|uniref:TetR/AcrR family transcriptional regulator n=1 Tax=unclassified Streptomyces TaxID=2593676 RepID=UPI002E22A7F3|nr:MULTISPECIES: hypothetical protein [unclassified Streptomyces]